MSATPVASEPGLGPELGPEQELDWPGAAYRCSTRSTDLGEDLSGTASMVRAWLLVEVPGPWPETAIETRGLPRELAVRLSRLTNRHGVRLVLIRRPGRSPSPAATGPACFVAWTGPSEVSEPFLARLPVGALDDLLQVDLGDLAAGRPPRGAVPLDGPLFCVCTHGRHDPCCAERGRPVAGALSAEFPERTWEVSHIGGDRFAANVLCFPGGFYLGRVPAASAAAIGRDYAAGRLPVEHLRGRMSDPPAVQAADGYLRRRLNLAGVSAVSPVRRQVDGAVHTVTFAVEHDRHEPARDPGVGRSRLMRVRVRAASAQVRRALTCHAAAEGEPPAYELLDILPA